MAARCLDVENDPGNNQVNIRHAQDWQITVLDPKRFIEIITVLKDIP